MPFVKLNPCSTRRGQIELKFLYILWSRGKLSITAAFVQHVPITYCTRDRGNLVADLIHEVPGLTAVRQQFNCCSTEYASPPTTQQVWYLTHEPFIRSISIAAVQVWTGETIYVRTAVDKHTAIYWYVNSVLLFIYWISIVSPPSIIPQRSKTIVIVLLGFKTKHSFPCPYCCCNMIQQKAASLLCPLCPYVTHIQQGVCVWSWSIYRHVNGPVGGSYDTFTSVMHMQAPQLLLHHTAGILCSPTNDNHGHAYV